MLLLFFQSQEANLAEYTKPWEQQCGSENRNWPRIGMHYIGTQLHCFKFKTQLYYIFVY